MVVIGGGAGGLTAAGGLARLGLRVALIERDRLGGECLHSGCVPSKALLAAAHRAAALRGDGLGIAAGGEPVVRWAAVREHVEAAIAAIAPHDAPERFAAWGVEVIRGSATLAGPETVRVDGRLLRAKRIVLAVGSEPAVPAIDGLASLPFLTNESVFGLDRLPEHLVILGGGPNGIELAQAFRRFGSAVTVIESGRALGAADADAAALLVGLLRAEGVTIVEERAAIRAAATPGGLVITLAGGGTVSGGHLLVAAGRRPRLDGLGLDRAGVEHGPYGIAVDGRGRTTNRRITAVGDCRTGPRLTHAAGAEGAAAVARTGFGLPGAVRHEQLPTVVYTEPELAQVGLTEAGARARNHRRVWVERAEFADNDRAVAEGDARGFIKLIRSGRRVVGVTIVGRGAGDLLPPWSFVLAGHASRWQLANLTIAYPTRSEISKSIAFTGYEPSVFGSAARHWAQLLARLRQ